jgi:uncharacterized protein (TIGR02996 family)
MDQAHEAFLRNMLESPNDQMRHFAYADWLEERGDTRAELVRLAWPLWTLDREPPPTKRKVREQRAKAQQKTREQELRGRCAEDWLLVFDQVNWKRICRQVTIDGRTDREFVMPSEKVVDKAAAAFEAERNVKLPISYRAYLRVFPAGVMCRCDINTPAYGKSAREKEYGLSAWNQGWNWFRRDYERLRHLIMFGGTAGLGDSIAWDTAEVCDSKTHEYRVYMCEHGDEEKPVPIVDPENWTTR